MASIIDNFFSYVNQLQSETNEQVAITLIKLRADINCADTTF